MATGSSPAGPTGEFLMKKSIFLLGASVGYDTAERLIKQALWKIGAEASTLTPQHIPALTRVLEPTLRTFAGDEKAQRLVSALRVLVGGSLSS